MRAVACSHRPLSPFLEKALASSVNALAPSRGNGPGFSAWPAIQAMAAMDAGCLGYLLSRLPSSASFSSGASMNQRVLNR